MAKYLFAVIAVLIAGLFITVHKIKSLNDKYEVAMSNVKSYDKALGAAQEKSIALSLTIDQLGYFNDSILRELNETAQELEIKKKNLKALMALHSTFVKTDTITLSDTIFIDPSLAIDTTLADPWYSLNLKLRYPSTIMATPKFVSKKNIIAHTHKETVNPPKKFFLFRWFQKKHLVLEVTTVEKNPYVQDESSRYVEIIK